MKLFLGAKTLKKATINNPKNMNKRKIKSEFNLKEFKLILSKNFLTYRNSNKNNNR